MTTSSDVRDELESAIGARRIATLELRGRRLPLALPGGEEEIVELLRLASARRWSVLPVGAGTKLGWGPPPARASFALSTRGLTGVVAFEAGDGTLTARSGSSMGALAQIARSAGNRMTPDVALAETATLGGVLGAGASGIDRLRFGPVRHHVLGMRVALADGTIAKCGGRLVKNVTGYDLHRLYTGSRGSVCVILEASLRLFAAPEREILLATTFFGRESALAAADSVLRSEAKPIAVVVENGAQSGRFTLHVALAGLAAVVARECDVIASAIGRVDTESEAARIALRDLEAGAHFRVATMPGELRSALASIDAACSERHLGAALSIQPGIASVDVSLQPAEVLLGPGSSASPTAEDIVHVARSLHAAGLEASPRDAPLELAAEIDPLRGVPEPARSLMQRLKTALDPQGLFAGDALGTRAATAATIGGGA